MQLIRFLCRTIYSGNNVLLANPCLSIRYHILRVTLVEIKNQLFLAPPNAPTGNRRSIRRQPSCVRPALTPTLSLHSLTPLSHSTLSLRTGPWTASSTTSPKPSAEAYSPRSWWVGVNANARTRSFPRRPPT